MSICTCHLFQFYGGKLKSFFFLVDINGLLHLLPFSFTIFFSKTLVIPLKNSAFLFSFLNHSFSIKIFQDPTMASSCVVKLPRHIPFADDIHDLILIDTVVFSYSDSLFHFRYHLRFYGSFS